MKIIRTACMSALLLGAAAFAADTPEGSTPKSPTARAALTKLATAQDAAKKAYERAMKEAATAAVAELEQARSDVMKQGGPTALEEANRIQAAIETIKSDGPARKELKVDARSDKWMEILQVRKGQVITIEASGKWCAATEYRNQYTFDPAGERKGVYYGLQARVEGSETLINIGAKLTFTADRDGSLALRVQGDEIRNNEGSINARVQANRDSATAP